MKVKLRNRGFEATQWFRHGDHLQVRPLTSQLLTNTSICPICHRLMKKHGVLQGRFGATRICPGNWIIVGEGDEPTSYTPEAYEYRFEPLNPTT